MGSILAPNVGSTGQWFGPQISNLYIRIVFPDFILVFYWSIAVCKCIGGCLVRDFQGIRAEYYKLLPMLCNHESNEIETHLAKDCIFTLGYMAQAILPLSVIPACLQAIHQVSKSGSWKARASVLGFLQVTMPYLNLHNGFIKIYFVHKRQRKIWMNENFSQCFAWEHFCQG